MEKEEYKLIRKKYKSHTGCARAKNVKYLTFEQYYDKIKEAKITVHQIGNNIDSYQLSRYTDQGDYTPESCRFVTMRENIEDRHRNGGTKRGSEKCSKILKERGIRPLVSCFEVTGEYPASKSYRLKSPTGEIYEGTNVAKFCRERGFTHKIHDMIAGKIKSYRGWTLA